MAYYERGSIKKPKHQFKEVVNLRVDGKTIEALIDRRYYDIDSKRWFYGVSNPDLAGRLFRESVIAKRGEKEEYIDG